MSTHTRTHTQTHTQTHTSKGYHLPTGRKSTQRTRSSSAKGMRYSLVQLDLVLPLSLALNRVPLGAAGSHTGRPLDVLTQIAYS